VATHSFITSISRLLPGDFGADEEEEEEEEEEAPDMIAPTARAEGIGALFLQR